MNHHAGFANNGYYATFANNETEAQGLIAQWKVRIRADWTIYKTKELIRSEHDKSMFGPFKAKHWASPREKRNVPDCEVRIFQIQARGQVSTFPYDENRGTAINTFMVMFPA